MDRSSNSKPQEVVVTHLDWNLILSFEDQAIHAKATYTVKVVDPKATSLCLDTNHLSIVTVNSTDGTPRDFTLRPLTPGKLHLGQLLEISLNPKAGDIQQVTVQYSTTKLSTALQWLPPAQTAGKKYPYMFTQCQAIHARSLVPCQDRCGVKMTYTATCSVPSWATCVMSAVLESAAKTDSDRTIYKWKQPVPISSYLIALAVGELTQKTISPRVAIWSEPSVINEAAYEFAETETFLSTAETLAGREYVWGRYDLLCLPPSFPYGGMENPCLTFVTPTLLAGDRSLADVVAHEIAHSWTGNLITNATWDHFWLNEGWTMWLQRKVMAKVKKQPKFFDFDSLYGLKRLQDAVEEMEPKNTRLVLDCGDGDPDDSYSAVAYEKGFMFLLYLEQLVGTHEFEAFFQAYVNNFAFRTLTSDDFRAFFLKHFQFKGDLLKSIDWDAWYYSPGMPPVIPKLDTSLASDAQALATTWIKVDREGLTAPTKNELGSWSSSQITCFLDDLQLKAAGQPLKLETVANIGKLYGFAKSRNSEILFRYCMMAIPAEDTSILSVATHFVTSQGRMKYTRPLYKALYKSKMGRELAKSTFLAHKDVYHPICTKMVAQDLGLDKPKYSTVGLIAMHVAMVAVSAVALSFLRGRKKN
eukprot:Nitzschia sp. Nitz4//scaffold58_size112336//97116//99041//NITZ4_004049-RA/size112336-processed-gene-0.94-mRNA-1//-1//CDS//3329555037//4390//frame0